MPVRLPARTKLSAHALPASQTLLQLAMQACCQHSFASRVSLHGSKRGLCQAQPSEPAAGTFYFVEFWLGFHVGFVGVCNGQRKLIMDGGAIARYYVLKGRFPIDTLTAVAWVAQVFPFVAHCSSVLAQIASRKGAVARVHMLKGLFPVDTPKVVA